MIQCRKIDAINEVLTQNATLQSTPVVADAATSPAKVPGSANSAIIVPVATPYTISLYWLSLPLIDLVVVVFLHEHQQSKIIIPTNVVTTVSEMKYSV